MEGGNGGSTFHSFLALKKGSVKLLPMLICIAAFGICKLIKGERKELVLYLPKKAQVGLT